MDRADDINITNVILPSVGKVFNSLIQVSYLIELDIGSPIFGTGLLPKYVLIGPNAEGCKAYMLPGVKSGNTDLSDESPSIPFSSLCSQSIESSMFFSENQSLQMKGIREHKSGDTTSLDSIGELPTTCDRRARSLSRINWEERWKEICCLTGLQFNPGIGCTEAIVCFRLVMANEVEKSEGIISSGEFLQKLMDQGSYIFISRLVSSLSCPLFLGTGINSTMSLNVCIQHHDLNFSNVLDQIMSFVQSMVLGMRQLDMVRSNCPFWTEVLVLDTGQLDRILRMEWVHWLRAVTHKSDQINFLATVHSWLSCYVDLGLFITQHVRTILDFSQGWSEDLLFNGCKDDLFEWNNLLVSLGAIFHGPLSNFFQIWENCGFFLIFKKMGAMVYTLIYVWVNLTILDDQLLCPKSDLETVEGLIFVQCPALELFITQQAKCAQGMLQWKDKPADTSLEDKTFSKARVMIGIMIM